MSTEFRGEGNIGLDPEYREFPVENDEPDRLLTLRIYFDNLVPTGDAKFEDRGGFWMNVELRHKDAHLWASLYQKGMRVLVSGRQIRDEWTDEEDRVQTAIRVRARRVGILPYRIARISMAPKAATGHESDTSDPE